MKKRVMALICAAMLVGSMSLTALAAPSVSGEVVKEETTQATTKDNVKVDVVVQKVSEENQKKADEIKDTANLKKELEKHNAYEAGMKVVDVKEVKVTGTISADQWPITITFKVNGVKAGDKVICLHWTGTEWEKIDTTTGEGTVSAKFNSLSPVAFVKVDTGSTTSPTTGEPIMVVWAIAAIVAGVAGIAYTSKKRA